MTTREKIIGTRNVAERMAAADSAFAETVAAHGKISIEDARKVVAVYWKIKAIKRSGVDRVVVKHGGLLDRAVIRTALSGTVAA